MLKQSKEFEHFGNFIEDSGGNAIRLTSEGEDIKEDQELQQWIPSDAFNMAN